MNDESSEGADERDPDRLEPRQAHHALPSGVELHALHWDSPVADPRAAPWLLVHGLASNARLWDGVAARLAAAGHRVVSVDLRGHGQSSKPDHGFDVPTVADDLALLIADLGWERPAVAGQSWGGNVVLELGFRHPGAVRLVACVDGGLIDLRRQFPDWEQALAALSPPRLAGTPLEQVERWVAASAGDWPEENRAGALANFEVRDDGTVAPWLTFDRHLTVLRGLWDHSPIDRYAAMQMPVLLIMADTGDRAWTRSKRDAVDHALETLPRGRAMWCRPADHDLHAQHPELVAGMLRDAVLAGADHWSGRATEEIQL